MHQSPHSLIAHKMYEVRRYRSTRLCCSSVRSTARHASAHGICLRCCMSAGNGMKGNLKVVIVVQIV